MLHLFRERGMEITIEAHEGTLSLTPAGVLWFGSAPRLERVALEQMAAHPEADRLVINAAGLGRVDLTGAHVIARVLSEARNGGMAAELHGVPVQAAGLVSRVMRSHEHDACN